MGIGNNVNQTEPVQPLAVVLDEDGNVEKDESGKVITEKITDAIDVVAGYNHTLVLRKDGTVWASGYNYYGQLGNGNTARQPFSPRRAATTA